MGSNFNGHEKPALCSLYPCTCATSWIAVIRRVCLLASYNLRATDQPLASYLHVGMEPPGHNFFVFFRQF